MITITRKFLPILTIIAIAIGSHSSQAEDKTTPDSPKINYKGIFGSSLVIDGTSTVHDWSVSTKLISGTIEFDSNFPIDAKTPLPEKFKIQPKLDITIPVRSIKSGKTRMDEVMHATLKRDQFPSAEYKLLSLQPSKKPRKEGDPLVFDSTGTLVVAGTTKLVKFPVKFEPVKGDILKISGQTKVKMSDFGMKPPTPKVALGLIKTGDEVDIKFSWVTKKQK